MFFVRFADGFPELGSRKMNNLRRDRVEAVVGLTVGQEAPRRRETLRTYGEEVLKAWGKVSEEMAVERTGISSFFQSELSRVADEYEKFYTYEEGLDPRALSIINAYRIQSVGKDWVAAEIEVEKTRHKDALGYSADDTLETRLTKNFCFERIIAPGIIRQAGHQAVLFEQTALFEDLITQSVELERCA